MPSLQQRLDAGKTASKQGLKHLAHMHVVVGEQE